MYKLVKSPRTGEINAVIKMESNIQLCIPFDPDNVDFQQYQKWLDAGNTPLSADEPNA